RHVDARRDATGGYYAALVHEFHALGHFHGGVILRQNVGVAPVRRGPLAIQQPRFSQQERPPAHGGHDLRLAGLRLDPRNDRRVVALHGLGAVAAGHDDDVEVRRVREAVSRLHFQTVTGGDNRAVL